MSTKGDALRAGGVEGGAEGAAFVVDGGDAVRGYARDGEGGRRTRRRRRGGGLAEEREVGARGGEIGGEGGVRGCEMARARGGVVGGGTRSGIRRGNVARGWGVGTFAADVGVIVATRVVAGARLGGLEGKTRGARRVGDVAGVLGVAKRRGRRLAGRLERDDVSQHVPSQEERRADLFGAHVTLVHGGEEASEAESLVAVQRRVRLMQQK